ncbi:MAG TPA: hypothetical protein VLE70_04320 [Anaerolineae bacterium]|nr:hypothetical protein [Anaerolineae bacterium]
MKYHLHMIVLMLLALSVLVACNTVADPADPTDPADPSVITPAETDSAPEAEKVSVANCPQPEADTHQLMYAAQGICFLYPDNYDVLQTQDGSLALYVRSPLNTEAPMAIIRSEALEGRSIQEVIPDYPSEADLATMSLIAIELGEETATVLDHLPGQDRNRRVITTHDDKVYDLMIARIGDEYGAVGQEAEALFDQITSSFQFIGIEPEAPLMAGPECPEVTADTILFTNAEDGFCMLLPVGYVADDSLTTEGGGTETSVYVGSPLDVAHARLFITVEDAGGRSLEEVTADKVSEVETALPGSDVIWSFGYMLDGVWANQFEQVPMQDLSRQVVLVRDGRLYTLTFIPDDPAADAYVEMQALYDLVLDSFSFLW